MELYSTSDVVVFVARLGPSFCRKAKETPEKPSLPLSLSPSLSNWLTLLLARPIEMESGAAGPNQRLKRSTNSGRGRGGRGWGFSLKATFDNESQTLQSRRGLGR